MAKETLTIFKGGEAFPPGIVIHDISETAPTTSFTGVDRASGIGQRITAYKRQQLDVTVKFAFYGRLNQSQRNARLNEVVGWALGDGPLTVGHRPGCELHARLLTLPLRQEQQTWEQDYSITFRAQELPYWVGDSEDTILRITSGLIPDTVKASVDGTAHTPLCATIKGAVTSVALTCGTESMTFERLGMSATDTFNLGCDERGVMYARINSTNVMSKLTTASADAIMLAPGLSTVGLTIGGATSSVKLYTKARWA